jgi:hypothetical protein
MASIEFNIGEVISEEGFETIYRGKFRGMDVAIKKYWMAHYASDKELFFLTQLNHPNVVKLLHWENRLSFRLLRFSFP